jgi:hypothetical protein
LKVIVWTALALAASGRVAAAQTPVPTAGTTTRSVLTESAQEEARDANLLMYVELLRSDLRTQVVAVITEVMQFSDSEDAAFWPIYREFETGLAKINDERMALIAEYAGTYDALNDEQADRMARKALELEARRQALKAEYYDRFKAALPAKTAARFLQVENQILLLLDLQIASSLPIASR